MVNKIQCAITGIPDKENPIPFSYAFLPPRAMWPDIFSKIMAEKIINKKQLNIYVNQKMHCELLLDCMDRICEWLSFN